MLWLGREGQDAYGRKNFLDLISVFTAPPLFTVLHGRRELGSVDESTFLARREDGPPVLLLAGRAWRVTPPRLEAAPGARRAGRGRGPLALAGRGPVPRRASSAGRSGGSWPATRSPRAGRRRAVAAHGGRPRRVPLADGGRRERPRHLGRRHRLVDVRRRPGQRRARPRAGPSDRRPGHVRQLRRPIPGASSTRRSSSSRSGAWPMRPRARSCPRRTSRPWTG